MIFNKRISDLQCTFAPSSLFAWQNDRPSRIDSHQIFASKFYNRQRWTSSCCGFHCDWKLEIVFVRKNAHSSFFITNWTIKNYSLGDLLECHPSRDVLVFRYPVSQNVVSWWPAEISDSRDLQTLLLEQTKWLETTKDRISNVPIYKI